MNIGQSIAITPNNSNSLDVEVVAPLKYLSNIWRFLDLLDLLLINCEIKLDLPWSKKCMISEISITPKIVGNPRNNLPALAMEARQTTVATFKINNAKLYVPVVTLSIKGNINFLENIKQGSKRTISWNKYRSEITTQPKNNNLDYVFDPTFRNNYRCFVLSFKNGNDDPMRDSFN